MKISADHIEKVTITLNGNPIKLSSVYCIYPVRNPSQNDYYNNDINNILDNTNIDIEENQIVKFKNENEQKCIYYDKLCLSDDVLDFTDLKMLEQERIFIVSNIRCSEDKKTMLWLGARNARIKIWINNKIIFNGISSFINCEVFLLNLSKGDNLVFVEIGRIFQDLELLKFSYKVIEYDCYIKEEEYEVAKSYINRDLLYKVQVIQDSWEIKRNFYEFKIIPRDFINLSMSQNLVIMIKDSGGNVYEKINTTIGEKIKLNIENIKCRMQGNKFLTMEIEYETRFGKRCSFINTLLIGDISNQMEIIKDKSDYFYLNNKFRLEYRESIENRIKILQDVMNEMNLFHKFPIKLIELLRITVNEIFLLFLSLESGCSYNDLKINNRLQYVYYKSKLDDNMERYSIILPDNYSAKKKYPLVIFLPGGRYDDDTMLSQSEINYDGVILAEISCRGMTFGSYIGEAAFFEALNKIINSYNVDENRIYLSGTCSGAYAAWALSEAYPDLFAAIVVSGGSPYPKNLQNLSNIRIKNICSDEFESLDKAYYLPSKVLETPEKYYQPILFKGTPQITLNYILSRSSYIVDWLLLQKKVMYPKKIFYRTDRIRHNKAYWVEVVSIENGKVYCKIEGEFESNSFIKVSLINVDKFILTLPHSCNEENIIVNINEKQVFNLKYKKDDEVYFEKVGDEYTLYSDGDKHINNSMGIGILDIYMDRLKIVIPAFFDTRKEEEVIKSVAKTFSQPSTSGVNPKIYIDYPVVTNKDICEQDLQNYNLVLIGQVYEGVLSSVKDRLPLKFYENGYEYKGFFKKGDYCVIMIYSNPTNYQKKILYIYANNYKLLKNVFTRKLIFPTYFSGIHPQLNSEVILIDDRGYYTIYTMGDDICRG